MLSGNLGRRLSLSLSTWFCAPEQGMRELEILSRSSAAVVATRRPNAKQTDYHVVTSSHVVAPWRWPQYYPEPWLRQLNERHTHYSVELRHPDGMFLAALDLEPTSFHHKCRDLAVLRFEDPTDALATLEEFEYRPLGLLADCHGRGGSAELQIGEAVTVSGHEILGEILDDGTDLRRPVPLSTAGMVRRRGGAWPATQCFLATERLLTLGMCGGPAVASVSAAAAPAWLHTHATHASASTDAVTGVRPASRRAANTVTAEPTVAVEAPTTPVSVSVSVLAGVVEGIVPVDYADAELAGMAVVVESAQVAQFVEEVAAEKVPVHDVLRGGEAAAWVGAQDEPGDEDGAGLDVAKLIERSEALAEADERKARASNRDRAKTEGGRSNFPM